MKNARSIHVKDLIVLFRMQHYAAMVYTGCLVKDCTFFYQIFELSDLKKCYS